MLVFCYLTTSDCQLHQAIHKSVLTHNFCNRIGAQLT